jgi:hypothetical protein
MSYGYTMKATRTLSIEVIDRISGSAGKFGKGTKGIGSIYKE